MNEDTLVAICTYAGDQHRTLANWSLFSQHEAPVVILSPADEPAVIPGAERRCYGKQAYIGQDTVDRQLGHWTHLLQFPHNFFLIFEPDSFLLTPKIPARLYDEARSGCVWSSEVVEPRPHASPYPKIALQAPYFLSRDTLKKFLQVGPRIPLHSITPYGDWWLLAMICETPGLSHRSFSELEHDSSVPAPATTDPWALLEYRIRYRGAIAVHPVKEPEHVALCVNARKFYEDK